MHMNSDPSPAPTETADSSVSLDDAPAQPDEPQPTGLMAWVKRGFRRKETSLRDTIEDYIDISDAQADQNADYITDHEKALLSNILKLRDIPVASEMVPRAEIVAVDVNISREELLQVIAENRVSRMPVYEDNLDHVLGSLHIKDILAALQHADRIDIRANLTDIPIISPAMPILDLIVEMRMSRRHMALVVDEHGGIDGLITLGDIIEGFVGEIDDEHDNDEPMMEVIDDGSLISDARMEIEKFEEIYGSLLNAEERELCDTLGGLAFMIAGRIPKRGECLTHKGSGMMLEVLDADPRRVHRLRIRNVPQLTG